MLTKAEFFHRFVSIIPGNCVPGVDPIALDAEVYFEPLSMSGLEEMHKYSTDARFYEYLEFDTFDSIDKTRAYIEKLEKRMAGDPQEKTAMYWFVRRKLDGYLIGTAALVTLDYGRQSVEWGYGVDPNLWGQGYILQMQEILKHYVFEVLQLNRLAGITMIENESTISSVLATGHRHEGTLRQFYCKNGRYHDGWAYGMLAEDYFEQKLSNRRSVSSYTVSDIIAIISAVLAEEEIHEASTNSNVMSWDSLSHMTIMVAISEKTGARFSSSQISRATSVKAIHSILNGIE